MVLLDQLAKHFALIGLSDASVPLIPNFLYLTLVRNTGIAFGFLNDRGALLFSVITASLFLLFFLANRSHRASSAERWAMALILGGAVGNWIDRVRFGAVVDFIDFRVWPVFNIADSAITVGVCIYILCLLRVPKKT